MLAVSDIPASDKPALTEALRRKYSDTRMDVMTRPEMLERGDGLSRTFTQAERMSLDNWNLLAPITTDDVEQSHGIRRFVPPPIIDTSLGELSVCITDRKSVV